MNKLSFIFALTVILSNMAIADNLESQIFSETIPQEIEVLSDAEMESTEGEWGLPGAIAGAAIGTWGYAGYLAGGGEFAFGSAFQSIVGGGIIGGFAGPGTAATRYMLPRLSGSIGVAGGLMDSVPKRTPARTTPTPVRTPVIQSTRRYAPIPNPFK